MDEKNLPESRPGKRKAVSYVRMSTIHQQYSTDNQKDVIEKYADEHIVLACFTI